MTPQERATAIIEAASDAFGVPVVAIIGRTKKRNCVCARWAAAYVMKAVCGFGCVKIAKALGDRDHTTILHALKETPYYILRDKAFSLRIELMKKQFS